MAEPDKPNADWREQIASITGRLSGLELKFADVVKMPNEFLKAWAGQQTALTAAFHTKFQTPAFQDLFKHFAEGQNTGLQKAFQNFFKHLAEGQNTGLQKALQTPEYQKFFAQLAESQKAWSQGKLSQIGAAFARFQSTAWQESWAELSKAIAEGMKQTRDALERVEMLAALGWTLPMRMSPREFHTLIMQDDLTVDGVDEWFLDYYSRDSGEEFNRLEDHLLKSDHLVFWKPLLEQVFDAFGRDQFAVCVPSLLSVLEGSIAVPWDVTDFHKERCRKEFFDQKISATRPDSIRRFQWKSVAAFVLTVFEGVDPNHEYSTPKRNLILHGKSDPARWDRADCLRLFQAIDTILSLGNELNATEQEKTGARKIRRRRDVPKCGQ